MDILDDMGVRKLSAKVFLKKMNYSFNFAFMVKICTRTLMKFPQYLEPLLKDPNEIQKLLCEQM